MSAVRRGLPVDQEARDRAVSDLDSSYCMEAGAGTGKTTLLVGRYLSIVKSGRAGCRQIVAITFTEKAAAEMKSRLRRDLERALVDSGEETDERANLSAAIDELEGAPISTIHAFASSILREYPVEAGVDPGFKLLDEIEGAMLLDECWNAFLGSASKDQAGLLRTWDMAGGSSSKLRDIAMSLYYNRGRRALSGLFDEPGQAGARERGGGATRAHGSGDGSPEAGGLAGLFEQAAARLGDLLESSQVDPEDRGLPRIGAFLDGMDILRSRTGRVEEEDALVFAVPKGAGSMSNWDPPGSCREQKAILQRLADAQAEARTGVVTGMREELTGWLGGFLESVERRKRDEGLLDFDDLLIMARELVDDEAVLRSIRRRYRYFLVDEFQDTDPVQAELVMLLAGGGGEEILPDPGRLFIVGDPKQSIYRFRKADIEIYEKVKRRFRESGSLLRISQNFRSLPGVTEWVNALFSRIITCPEGRYYQPDYEPVHAWREGDEAAVISLGLEPGETGADAWRRAEGSAVAGFIRALVDSGREVMDPVDRSRRPVRLGDIAVLYRGTTGIEHYEDSLREGGIPYIVEGGKLY
ncbi:MAG TPA: UvrD-helicase domain-containing protein, partial [Candidatus Krumholzibacterium sp.]|nr:UvrD-helicase domain-containing protein [Candidatus Krumholzibacterium sp.]